MGKAEKIVVLGVLFLIVVILAVSLDGGPDGTDPLGDGSGEVHAAEIPEGPGRARENRISAPLSIEGDLDGDYLRSPADEPPDDGGNPPLLSSVVDVEDEPVSTPEEPPVEPAASEIPEGWDLVELAGLEVHPFDSDVRIYTCRGDETFEDLAVTYYGDAARVALLERNNEGIRSLREGQQILVPVVDDVGTVGETYEVQEGESLWIVAEKFYGKGYLWGEIFEANRDVLASPDALRAGTVLRIP